MEIKRSLILSPNTSHQPQPIKPVLGGLDLSKKHKRIPILIISILVLALIATGIISFIWYKRQLAPLDSNNSSLIGVDIISGSTPKQIGQLLEDKNIIHSATAFNIYTYISKTQYSLKAGYYRLSPSSSIQVIVNQLTEGLVCEFNITFLPGATLKQNQAVLRSAGFSQAEIEAAFAKTYGSPLFKSKPETADLEGFLYDKTYRFTCTASVEDILNRIFNEFYAVIKKYDLETAFNKQGLNLFQAITLASIIQREESSNAADQKQIAQVFYKRLSIDMPLGSDATYQYIADKLGVARDTNLDSFYNTRRYKDLPPGPIASPGLSALQAVAAPADGDYLYFLNGDDGVTYFAYTNEEHEANIANHCQVKCQEL
jgi:UPF0755 protein